MLNAQQSPKIRLNAIDLFCGSGAVTEGLKSQDFNVLAAVDLDPVACATYRLNHPDVILIQEDIRNVDASSLLKDLGENCDIDLLVVCAPCQPFSTQNRHRNKIDSRTDLIMESVRFVEAFTPKLIFIENVPGLVKNGPLAELEVQLRALGYYLSNPLKLDAANLGVPQRRERCIMIATQNLHVASTFGQDIKPLPKTTVRLAIGSLKPLVSGESCSTDAMHRARDHQNIVLERLAYIPQDGGSRHSLPPQLELACHKDRKNDFPDVYGRMKWDDVAPTLTTGCTDVTKGRFAHPRDARAITLREAALLQTFPLSYKFFGNGSQVAKQIGNAVPVNMIRTLAPYLSEAIHSVESQ